MRCTNKSCKAEAQFIHMLCVPTSTKGEVFKLMLDYPLCNEHVTDVKVPDCIDNDVKRICAEKTDLMPDYDKAYVLRRCFNSEETIWFMEEKRKYENPAPFDA
jgi:hypothetical protein